MKIASNRIADPMRQWEAVFAVVVVLIGIALSGCSNQTKPEQNGDEAPEQSVTTEDETQQLAVPGPVEQASEVEQVAELPPTEKEQLPTISLEPRQGVMGSLVNYYRPLRIALAAEPQEELNAEPEYASEKPLYGAIQLGDGADTLVTLVVDEAEGETPRIYIDRDNDEDLTNDGDGEWTRPSGSNLGLSGVVIDVDYKTETVPYTFEFYRFTTRLKDCVLYYRNAAREGEITSDGLSYKIAVLDENGDGRFDDLDNGTVIIDLNQDGKLVGSSDSAEHHKLGEPFNIHGKVWEVASLTPDGKTLTLRLSTAEVAMKLYLDPGCPAPTFVGNDLEGNPINLTDEGAKAEYVLLDFWASWCGPCRAEYPYLRRLNARYKDHGLKIIGVNLDEDRDKAVHAAEENLLTYSHVFDGGGWKNAVAVLYRVHGIPQTYLLDKELNILAKGLRGSAIESRLADLLGPGDAKAAEAVDAQMAEPTPPDKPDSQAGKGQILLEVNGNPETVAPGEKTTITVTVHVANGSPLSDANVTVSAGGGKFLPSAETPFDPKSRLHGPYSAMGTTDSQGQFTTWWVCNPCARGYVLGIEASKGGEVSSRTEYTIHIKQ